MFASILVWFIVVVVLIFLLRQVVRKCIDWREPPIRRQIIVERNRDTGRIYAINTTQFPGGLVHYQATAIPREYTTEILFASPSMDHKNNVINSDKELPTYEEVIRQSQENITENSNVISNSLINDANNSIANTNNMRPTNASSITNNNEVNVTNNNLNSNNSEDITTNTNNNAINSNEVRQTEFNNRIT